MNRLITFILTWIGVLLVLALNWAICLIGRELSGGEFLSIWELTIITTLAHSIGLHMKEKS